MTPETVLNIFYEKPEFEKNNISQIKNIQLTVLKENYLIHHWIKKNFALF